MRTVVLVAVTLILLAGAFAVYWELQPPSRAAQSVTHQQVSVPPKPTATSNMKEMRPGSNAFFLEFDPVTGELVRKFRAKEYIPQNNGTVLVKSPEVWFYSANRQQVHLTGTDGEIVLKQMPDFSIDESAGKDKAPPAPPNRGHLNHVTIYLIDPDPKNNLVMTTNNVHFDNDTMFINTESFMDAQGHLVAPDEVPVHVEGNYKFDGRGLTMRWNEKDGRLEMLEIAHGQVLEIDDTSGLSGFTSPTGVKTAPATQPIAALPIAVVSADPAAAGEAIKSGPQSRPRAARTARPPAAPTPYLATFYDNVTVTQGDLALITAERMEVQFMTRQDQAKSATRPTTAESQSGNGAAKQESSPAKADSSGVTAATTRATPEDATISATQPATKPSDPPVFVRWTGKLTIVPTPPDRRLSVPAGSAVVSLFGKPVTILRTDPATHERTDIRSAVAIFHTFDRSAALFKSVDVPEVLIKKFAAGKVVPTSNVTAASVDYAGGQRLAVLDGPGHVVAPADESAPDKGNLDVRWDRLAKVFLTDNGKSRDELAVEHMDLSGNVNVRHPQLNLRSQELSLFFTQPTGATTQASALPMPPATMPSTRPAKNNLAQSQLQRVLATTQVWCELIDAAKRKQTVEGDRLELLTAQSKNGQFQPRQVNADGNVHAFDDQQDLRAGRVELTLKPAVVANGAAAPKSPTTRPADQSPQVELERLHAIEHVVVVRPDHSVVRGDDLEITTENSEPHVRLTAVPSAQVVDAKQNVMTGPLILFEPKRQLGHVVGIGSLHMMPEQGGQPADVHWTERADFSGLQNTVDAFGQIAFSTLDKDGSVVTGSGQRIHIDLQNKPPSTTRPSTRPSAAPPAGSAALPAAVELSEADSAAPITRKARTASDDPMKMDAMGDKELKAVTLAGEARVISTLSDEKGALLRRTQLEGDKLVYQIAGTSAQPAHTLLVPGAGRLLMQDHMPAEKRAPKDSGSGIESGQGDTAFRWQDRMLYNEGRHQAFMDGHVHIVHRTLGGGQEPVYVDADQVTANFEPAPAKPATQPATAPATRPTTVPTNLLGASNSSLHLKSVQADGHVAVLRAGSRLDAQRIDFDPNTHVLIAYGTRERPAVFTSATGTDSFNAEEIHWNTQTWQVIARDTGIRGRGK